MYSPDPPRIAFFAHERGDARVVKRIAAFRACGLRVLGFMFHRDRGKEDVRPAWRNIELGTTYNRRYLHRLWTLAKSTVILWRERDRLGDCAMIYVVNTDNAVLALIGRFFTGTTIPVVLELADIQPLMVGKGLASKIARSVERWVLRRCALLVTTSPGFVRNYFHPIQQYKGKIFLLENKVYPSDALPEVPVKSAPVSGGHPWVIGYFGAFRCRRSMQLIHALAERLGDKVLFKLRGYPSGVIVDEFPELLGDLPNMVFDGPYSYPGDLAEMYGGVDLNWCFDDADPGGNSIWLLPNRIYEGSCFKVPALSADTTETGNWVESHQAGWKFSQPLEESFAAFFETLDLAAWRAMAGRVGDISPEEYKGENDYLALAEILKKECILCLWPAPGQEEF